MESVLITGANRGLGLGFVKYFLPIAKHIFSCCRSPDTSKELQELASSHDNIHIIQIDVQDEASMISAFALVSSILGERGLNILINNAGCYHNGDTCVENVTSVSLKKVLDTNTIGIVLMVKTFISLLRKATIHYCSTPVGVQRTSIVNLISGFASISETSTGGHYASRMSRAATNMLTRTLSIELADDHIFCISMNPGWVKTDQGGDKAPLVVADSINQMMKTMLSLTEKDNGTFWNYNGKEMAC